MTAENIKSSGCSNPYNVTCTDCSLNPICLPVAVDNDQLEQLDRAIKRGRALKKGEYVFHAGQEFHSVYAVRSGTIKTFTSTEEGEEQITGFYLPGELLGMDGINTNQHVNSAKALESASICEIPFNKLEKLSTEIPNLQRHFFQLMSKEIQADQRLILLLSKKPADQRVASFLLSISARHEMRGLSSKYFHLPMSRGDIGNYLGLAVETVSRIFTKFQKSNLISAEGKDIEITDADNLCKMSNGQI